MTFISVEPHPKSLVDLFNKIPLQDLYGVHIGWPQCPLQDLSGVQNMVETGAKHIFTIFQPNSVNIELPWVTLTHIMQLLDDTDIGL